MAGFAAAADCFALGKMIIELFDRARVSSSHDTPLAQITALTKLMGPMRRAFLKKAKRAQPTFFEGKALRLLSHAETETIAHVRSIDVSNRFRVYSVSEEFTKENIP
jgi:hypothetical protein